MLDETKLTWGTVLMILRDYGVQGNQKMSYEEAEAIFEELGVKGENSLRTRIQEIDNLLGEDIQPNAFDLIEEKSVLEWRLKEAQGRIQGCK